MPGDALLLRRLIAHLPGMAVGLINLETSVLEIVDGPALALVGSTRDRYEGRSIWSLVPVSRRETVMRGLSAVARGESLREDYPIPELGLVFEMEFIPFPSDDGPITHALYVSRDVTVDRAKADQLSAQGAIDSLTGLPRRGILLAHLAGELRKKREFIVLFIDLDGFKSVNDSAGHAAGDDVLRHVARAIQRITRPTDLPVRVGGDEFVVVMADVNPELVRGRLQRAIDAVVEPHGAGCSIGYALYPRDGHDPETLLVCADRAMYAQKKNRRR